MSFFEELKRIPENLSRKAEKCELYPSTVYGPTCAGVDVVLNNILLPEAQIGDWWFFDNMGAYSSLLSLGFNGYMVLKTGFYISQDIWHEIAEKLDPECPLFEQYRQPQKLDR
ncbi:ornithine decarboxylase 1-like [Ciona intestinalis]